MIEKIKGFSFTCISIPDDGKKNKVKLERELTDFLGQHTLTDPPLAL